MAEEENSLSSATDGSRPKIEINIDIASLLRASRVYIAEHFLMHIGLALVVISLIGLEVRLVDHFLDDSSGYGSYRLTSALMNLSLYVSMLLVGFPLFAVFYVRTRKAERANLELYRSRARRWLNYFAIAVYSLVAIGYTIAVVNATVSHLLGVEQSSYADGWLQATLKQLFAALCLGFMAFFVSRLIPGLGEGSEDEK